MGVAAIHGAMRCVIISGMKIGDLVIRTDKYDKRNTEHRIGSERDLKYHLDLQAQGYEYTVVGAKNEESAAVETKKEESASAGTKKEEFDFDLPEEKNGLRIHRARPEDCESCSA